jgi:N-acetyl-gamma-glutamyl-phosphate reductase
MIELAMVCGHSTAGEPLSAVFPAFAHSDLVLQRFDADKVVAEADVAFLALPHGTAQEATEALRSRGIKVIDLSADHRFDDPEHYADVYGAAHLFPGRLREAVYGLAELNRERIKGSSLIACPGCYPTSVTLAVVPALKAGLLSSAEVIADCKSGLSGAGCSAKLGSLFAERGESMQGYKTLAHRHAPEMEITLNKHRPAQDDHSLKVHFSPHLVPMSRGILSSVYLRLRVGVDEAQVRQRYLEFYQDEPFVTLLPEGQSPNTLSVRGTNRCQLGLTVSGDLLVVHAAIDNLGKGAAGQAIQCFNLISDLEETLGLGHVGVYP